MTFHPFAFAGALVAASISVVAATPVLAANTVHVPYGATTADGATMDTQLHQAARAVCFSQEPRDLSQRAACTDAAYRDAREQLRLAQNSTSPVAGR